MSDSTPGHFTFCRDPGQVIDIEHDLPHLIAYVISCHKWIYFSCDHVIFS